MIWLAWRQFRLQAWLAAAALAVLAIALAVTGPGLTHLFDLSGIPGCQNDCGQLAGNFMNALAHTGYELVFYLAVAIMFLIPGIIGVFWGAPLITREIESGTLRLAWSQSITRTRWLAGKLALAGLAAMATAGLLSLMVSWWAVPVDRATGLAAGRTGASGINRFTPVLFGAQGIAPVGYAALAFVLGVTLGVLIRRTVPAMAATLAAFAGIQIAWPLWVRPHLMTPLTWTAPFNPAMLNTLSAHSPDSMTIITGVRLPGSWILTNQTLTASGQADLGPVPAPCKTGTWQACQTALLRLHLRQIVSYQPASRYWEFQWIETGIFLTLALALAGFSFWRVRRRLFG